MKSSSNPYPRTEAIQFELGLVSDSGHADAFTHRTLHAMLEQRTGYQLDLTITDNSSSMLTVRRCKNVRTAKIRLHHMFLNVDSAVLNALTRWIVDPQAAEAGATIDEFIRANRHRIRKPDRRRIFLYPKGFHYDLQELFDEVNAEHFDGKVQAYITWGRRSTNSKKQRSIRFGSYSVRDNLIRIHSALDDPVVPRYFVRFIVFHEMLHAHLGVTESENGRRRLHPAEFRKREQAYPDYDRATKWENNSANLRRLLR